MNEFKIKGRIVECGYTQTSFANAMGIKQSTLSQKISGKRKLSLDEMKTMMKLLSIDLDDVPAYFF